MINKQHGGAALKLAALCFAVYIVYLLITQQSSISQKRYELASIEAQIEEQTEKNEELQYRLISGEKSTEAYAEEYARKELGYALQDERVFVNIGGN